MSVLRFVLHLLGWIFTVVFQFVGSYLIIFVLSVIFAGVDVTSRGGWLLLLFIIWLGYVLGVNLVGTIALRWVWQGVPFLGMQRLIGSMAGALLPLVILLIVGYSVPAGGEGSRFNALITNNWQPILAQASLFASIVGYFVPGMLRQNLHSPTND
ncbi:MAG: hypothetical protein ACM3H7_01890 [Acidobacteriaceae bacterium]